MSTEVKLPELGENVASGDLVKLLVKPGDRVEKDQPLLELETDKATIEVPSPSSGTVSAVHVREGEKLKVGQAILSLESQAGASASGNGPSGNGRSGKRDERSTPAGKSGAAEASAAEKKPATTKPDAPASAKGEGSKPQASPAAQSAAGKDPGKSGTRQVVLPELGENIVSGDLVKVLVKPGDRVEKDQPLIELETDKATIEVPSSDAGTVAEILVKQGDKIKVGQAILTLTSTSARPGEDATSASKAESGDPKPAEATPMAKSAEPAQAAEEPAGAPQPERTAPLPAIGPSPAKPGGRSPADVAAPPSVRQLAREIGVDITEVEGSGAGGRVSMDDVKRHARERRAAVAGAGAPQLPLPDFSKWGAVEREPMNAVRRATARQMAYAWSIPHVTQNDTADVTELEQLRQRYAARAEELGGKLTTTAVALKIVAGALKAFPKFAASLDLAGEQIIYKKYAHIGVAVDTERGLVVPVIRDVEHKNILELSVELAQAAAKARNRKLAPADLEGGVFTITNLGGIGGTFFTPIINAPQVAILGIARAEWQPVYRPPAAAAEGAVGHFEPRLVLPLSLSYDHRIIDGAEAARFLRWLAEAFEQPFLLSLEG